MKAAYDAIFVRINSVNIIKINLLLKVLSKMNIKYQIKLT